MGAGLWAGDKGPCWHHPKPRQPKVKISIFLLPFGAQSRRLKIQPPWQHGLPRPLWQRPPWLGQFPPPGQPVPGAAGELELPVLLVKCQRSPGNDQRDSSPCPQGHAVLLLPTACPRPCCPGCPRDPTVPASCCQPTLQDRRPSLSFVHLFRKTTNQPTPPIPRQNQQTTEATLRG